MSGKLLSADLERQLRDVIRWYKSQSISNNDITNQLREPAPLRVFRNNSGETVPAYAVMEVTDIEVIDGRNIAVIRKPTGDATKPHVINGPRAVASTDRGQWEWGTVKVAVTGTPTAGAEWGVASANWTLTSAGDPIFRMMGLLETGFAMGQPLGGNGGVETVTVVVGASIASGDLVLTTKDIEVLSQVAGTSITITGTTCP